MMDVTTLALVALGGAIGTLARYGLALAMAPFSQSMPWGTIAINVVGSFVIGLFGALTAAHGRYPAAESTRLFVMVGFCGGFTTFSSFSLQTLDLLREGTVTRALVNIGASVALCLVAVALGQSLGTKLAGGPPEPLAQRIPIEDNA